MKWKNGCLSMLFWILCASAIAFGASQGVVFEDANRNGVLDLGEKGIAGIPISDGASVSLTGPRGTFEFPSNRPVFVSPPNGWWTDRFWLPPGKGLHFALYRIDVPTHFRFIQVTDIHLMPKAEGNLRQFVDFANASADIAFVVATGDLLMAAGSLAEHDQVEAAFGEYIDIMSHLEVPLFNVLGNNDCACKLPRDDPYWHKGAYRALLGPTWYSFNYGGWHFVVLDTNHPGCPTWESLPQEQFDWLLQDLALIPPDTPLVLFSHVPLFLCQHFKELLQVLSGHRVKVAASGHLHVTAEFNVKFPQVIAGALSGRWWKGGGLSWEGRNMDGSPQGYELFEVEGGDIHWEYVAFRPGR